MELYYVVWQTHACTWNRMKEMHVLYEYMYMYASHEWHDNQDVEEVFPQVLFIINSLY